MCGCGGGGGGGGGEGGEGMLKEGERFVWDSFNALTLTPKEKSNETSLSPYDDEEFTPLQTSLPIRPFSVRFGVNVVDYIITFTASILSLSRYFV